MEFIENNLLIPIKNISLIPEINKSSYEHFTEEDYKKINDKIKKLQDFNKDVLDKIKLREDNLNKLNENNDAYNTFIHMFDNIQERNETYYKTLMLLITLIFILILSIISYYIYYKKYLS